MDKVNIILNNVSLSRPNFKNVNVQEFALSEGKYNEIFVGNCLCYLDYDAAINFTIQCLDKLETGGILTIQNYDIVVLSEKLAKGQLDIASANQVLAKRNSYHSIFSIIDSISSYPKFRVYKKDVENYQFILKLEKI